MYGNRRALTSGDRHARCLRIQPGRPLEWMPFFRCPGGRFLFPATLFLQERAERSCEQHIFLPHIFLSLFPFPADREQNQDNAGPPHNHVFIAPYPSPFLSPVQSGQRQRLSPIMAGFARTTTAWPLADTRCRVGNMTGNMTLGRYNFSAWFRAKITGGIASSAAVCCSS